MSASEGQGVVSPLVGKVRRREGFVRLSHPDGRATRYPVSAAFAHHAVERGREAVTARVPPVGVAYAVPRRSGSAVTRNQLRRRLRSAVGAAAARGALPHGLYLVRAEPAAKALQFEPLCEVVSEVMGTAAARAGEAPGSLSAVQNGGSR